MSNIEDTIRNILGEAKLTPAMQSYPGADRPREEMPVSGIPVTALDDSNIEASAETSKAAEPAPAVASADPQGQPGINIEFLENDRPGVDTDVKQATYPGQNDPEQSALGAEYETLDPYDPSSDIVLAMEKEGYPQCSGADDVLAPSIEGDADIENRFSAKTKQAAKPAPFVAEGVESKYQVLKAAKINGNKEGAVIELDKAAVPDVEKKLGLPSGTFKRTSNRYSDETVVVKGDDGKLHTLYTMGGRARIRAYGHNDDVATEKLKRHLNEAAEAQPEDQEQVLKQAIAAVVGGAPVEEVAKAIGMEVKALQDAIDAAKPTASPAANITPAPVSEAAIDEAFKNPAQYKEAIVLMKGPHSAESHQKMMDDIEKAEGGAIGHPTIETIDRAPAHDKDGLTAYKTSTHFDDQKWKPEHINQLADIVGAEDSHGHNPEVEDIVQEDPAKYGQSPTHFEALAKQSGFINEPGSTKAVKYLGKNARGSHEYGIHVVDDEGKHLVSKFFAKHGKDGKLQGDYAGAPYLEGDKDEAKAYFDKEFHGKTVDESFTSDIKTILDEEVLSEDFKDKASALFEAAVIARVNHESDRIKTLYEGKLDEQVATLQEQYVSAVETFASKQSTRLNEYINYLGEQWLKKNQVAVQQGTRQAITESFMDGLQKLFLAHNINAPEAQINLAEEKQEEVAKLQESNESLQAQLVEAKEANDILKRDAIIHEMSDGMTSLEVAKLHNLCEGMTYESEEIFEAKVEMVKKNFFQKKTNRSPETILETYVANNPQPEEAPSKKPLDNQMKEYVEALNRFKRV